MQKRGLGRGLGALLNENSLDMDGITTLPINEIEPNRGQPRTDFDEETLAELAESIKLHGILQPLLVRPLPAGIYQIVAGERRWRAARMAGLSELPVIIRQLNDDEVMLIALIENLQREQLNILEEAEGYRRLQAEFGMTQEQIADKVGKSRPAIANALRILSLPEDVLDLLKDDSITQGHAKVLLSLPPQDQRLLAQEIVKRDLSVRDTEKLAKRIKNGEKIEPAKPDKLQKPVIVYEAENFLCEKLGRKVQVNHKEKKGIIQIEYCGQDDLKALLSLLGEQE